MARISLLLGTILVALVLVTLSEGNSSRFDVSKSHRHEGHSRHCDAQPDKHMSHRDLTKAFLRLTGTVTLHANPNPAFLGKYIKMNWWEGPNVCKSESESLTNSTGGSSHYRWYEEKCVSSDKALKCTVVENEYDGRRKKIITVFDCCLGYAKKRKDFGCPQKVNLKNMIDTAIDLGLTDFVKAIQAFNLTRALERENITVFIPRNGAFSLNSDLVDSGAELILKDAPAVITVSETAVENTLKSFQNAILGHIVPSVQSSSYLENDEMLETANPGGSVLKITLFNESAYPSLAVNCIKVQSFDHQATNGLIHIIGKAIKPVTDNLLDILRTRDELSTLKTIVTKVNFVPKLTESGELTLLAPTNNAFDKMNPSLKERLLSGDPRFLEKVLQNHLIPNGICSVIIQGRASNVNVLGNTLNMLRTQDRKLFFNGAQAIQTDILGTNGVMHIVDAVLVPNDVLSVIEVLKSEGLTEFVSLIEKAGLTKSFVLANNVTVFAPRNEAFENLPSDVKSQLYSDPQFLKDVLNYHVTTPMLRSLLYARQLPSKMGEKIRVSRRFTREFVNGSFVTKIIAQCAPVNTRDIMYCNGNFYVLSGVMIPPKGNVIDVLSFDKKFSTFLSLLKVSGLADSLQEDGPFIVLAPNNKAFEKLGQQKLDALSKNTEELKTLLSQHIGKGVFCCSDLHHSSGFHRLTLSGRQVPILLTNDEKVKAGNALVVTCDQTATNGNVLEIDLMITTYRRNPGRWFRGHFSSTLTKDYESWI